MNELSDMRSPLGFINRLLTQLHRDESGATLTEFVVMLPIFLLVFYGVMELGQFSRKGSEAPIKAYKQTFDQALEYQKDFYAMGWNVHATSAAVSAGDQLAGTAITSESSPVHNRSTSIKVAANATEATTYLGLGANGHMGESHMRTEAVGMVGDLQGCEGAMPPDSNDCIELNPHLTNDLRDLVGESDFAYGLLNDGPDASSFSGMGGGVFSSLNNVLSGIGIRPAMAAGIRYGTVTGRHDETYSFAGRDVEMNAFFNTLVPPGTHGGGQGPRVDALYATAISRFTMQGQDHYADLPGIKWSQPLDSKTIDVPDYP